MSLRQEGWGSLAFVPRPIWKIPQIQEPEEFIQEKTYNDLENELENKSAAKKEIKRRNEIFRDIVTTFFKKQISDIGDESVEYLSSISNTNSEEIIRFIETKESTIDSKIKTALRKAKEEQPEFYKTERSLRDLVGIDKTNSDTLSWLYIINSMGFNRETHTFDSSKRFLEWDIETINYQKNIIDNCLYTSRVHDLLDLSREGNQLAEILLKRLADQATDEYEYNFLLGKEKYLSFTNESLRDYLKRWISGNIDDSNPIKYFDVRKVTDMKELFPFDNLKIPPHKHVLDLTYWDVSSVTDMSSMFYNSNFIITGIKNWNTKNVKDMGYMFQGARSFNQNIESWDTRNVINMSHMFQGATSFNQNIGTWETGNVWNMSFMFEGASSFNQNIGTWKTGNVRDMSAMFYNATSFNQNIGTWETGKVENMSHMFEGATYFNQDIGTWETSNVWDMSGMFKEARSFNQNIGKWKTGNVKIMSHMFEGARSFNQDIGLWKTERVTSMSHMFEGAQSFNQDIGTWETSNVTNMSHMFKEARSFNQNIGTWDTSNVTNMTDMFKEARSFNQNIGTWKTGNVRDMSAMFFNATSFNQDIGTWETGNVENMTRMFQRATSFNKNIGTWDTKNVITMNYMFYYAISFNQDIRKWKTGKVENMSQMFAKAKLFNQKIGTWETGNVENMSYMFEGATSFNQNIGTWETGNVRNMSAMFYNATSFNQDIGTWDIGNVRDMSAMFYNATSFNQDIGTWKTGNVENMSYMFKGATSFNQEIGTWDIGNVGDITDMFKGATSFSKETPKCSSIISAPYDEGPSRISSEVHMMIPTIESTTTFTGGETLVGMMYLLYKYPEYCVVIPEIMSSSSYLLSPKYQDRWNEVQLCWNELLEDFDIPYGLWDSIKECLNKKPKPNFIVIPFVFLCKYNIGHHSNCLIYDSNTKELERFDPNGTSINECYNPPYLEKKLKYLFNSNVQEGMIEKVYAPLSFCPKRSFQALQGSEGKEKPGDPGGFCTAWAAWYADTRLANPNKTRKQVVEMGLKKFEDEPGLMTQYIRSYSVFITKAEELLKKSNNPASVFRLLIEKSKYT